MRSPSSLVLAMALAAVGCGSDRAAVRWEDATATIRAGDSGEDDSGEDDSGEDDSGEDDSGEDDSGGGAEQRAIDEKNAQLATKQKANDDERARLKTAKHKADDDERARLAAQAVAKKADDDEEARVAARAVAKKKADDDEEARVTALARAKQQADDAEKARLAADAVAKKKAAGDEKARLAAEALAKKQAEQDAKDRTAAENAALKQQTDDNARIAAAAAKQKAIDKKADDDARAIVAAKQKALDDDNARAIVTAKQKALDDDNAHRAAEAIAKQQQQALDEQKAREAAQKLALASLPTTMTLKTVPLAKTSVACVVAVEALSDALAALARWSAAATKQQVTSLGSAFIVVRTDPARSTTEPPPLLCRPVVSGLPLRAPLVGRDDHKGTLVVAGSTALLAASEQLRDQGGRELRVLVDDDGKVTAIAVVR